MPGKKRKEDDEQVYWYVFQLTRYSLEYCRSPGRASELKDTPSYGLIYAGLGQVPAKAPDSVPEVLMDWYEEHLKAGRIQPDKTQLLTQTEVR